MLEELESKMLKYVHAKEVVFTIKVVAETGVLLVS